MPGTSPGETSKGCWQDVSWPMASLTHLWRHPGDFGRLLATLWPPSGSLQVSLSSHWPPREGKGGQARPQGQTNQKTQFSGIRFLVGFCKENAVQRKGLPEGIPTKKAILVQCSPQDSLERKQTRRSHISLYSAGKSTRLPKASLVRF